jgi:hypothetical protein
MKRSFSLALAAALPLLAATTAAYAEQPIVADDAAAHPTPQSAPPPPATTETHPLILRNGLGFLGGNVNGASYLHADTSVGVGHEFTPWMFLYLDMHWGTTRFGFNGSLDDSLAVDTTLWARLDISVAAGTRFTLLRRGPWRFDLGAEFETSVLSSNPTVEDLHVTTPQGRYDVRPYAQEEASFRSRWYRAELMSTLHLRLGPLEPRFGVGIDYVHGMLDVMLGTDGRSVLTQLGHDSTIVESPHALEFADIVLAPGLDIRLGRFDTVAVTGLMMPGSAVINSYGASVMVLHRF